MAQIYRFRNSAAYRRRTHDVSADAAVGDSDRRAARAAAAWLARYLRIDTVHQGDRDYWKGIYHINAVDEVTQWEIGSATPQISELWLIPLLETMLQQFPFVIRGFHSGQRLGVIASTTRWRSSWTNF